MFQPKDNLLWITPWKDVGHFSGEVTSTFCFEGTPFVECLCTDPKLSMFKLRFIAPQKDCFKIVPEMEGAEIA